MEKELKTHTYYPGRSICFVVTDPKPREIFAATFRDRIVHHILVNYLEPIWEPKFIDQSYSCRKGKGAHRALLDLRRYIRQVSHTAREKVYYLKIDIQSFFVSLRKDVLLDLIQKRVKNKEVLWLTKLVIFHNPTRNYYRKSPKSLFNLIPDHKSLFKVKPTQGLPIGNLTSQFFANVYLDPLDQFIKHKLKVKYYLRYVDDLLFLSQNKVQLVEWKNAINHFLDERLGLRLHPDKQVLREVREGIDFVGFVVKPDYVLMRQRIVHNLKNKLWRFNRNKEQIDQEKIAQMLSIVNSYYGQFKHAKTFSLRRKLYENNFDTLKNFLRPKDKNFNYFRSPESRFKSQSSRV